MTFPDWHVLDSNERMLWSDFIQAAGFKPSECVESRPSISITVGGRDVPFEVFCEVHKQSQTTTRSSS